MPKSTLSIKSKVPRIVIYLYPTRFATSKFPLMSVDTSNQQTMGPRDSKGWDGKLRIEKRAVVTNAEALSDPDHSDEDAPPVEQIAADEGSANEKLTVSYSDELMLVRSPR